MYSKSSLPIALTKAKLELVKITNTVMHKYGIPASLMDGILSTIQSDIRAQISIEMIADIESNQKEGEKLE